MSKKTPWFDAHSEAPMLAEYARKLDSFLDVVADGRVEVKEIEEQEHRVVALMKEVEPLLSPRVRCQLALLTYLLTYLLHHSDHWLRCR